MKTQKFKVFGQPWTIQEVKCIVNPDNPNQWRWGESDNVSYTVKISQESLDGRPVPERTKELTKLHELVHVMLDEGQYTTESCNEGLVEWLAKCMLSLKEQNVI